MYWANSVSVKTRRAEELEDDDETDDELDEATDELADELDEAVNELDEDVVEALDATLVVVDVVDDVPDEATEVLAELASLDNEVSEERLAEEDEAATAQEASKNANPTKAMVKNDFFFMVFPLLYKIEPY